MDNARGFRRLALFLTLLYWGVVAWAVANPPWDYEDGYGYGYLFDPSLFLGQALVVYLVLFGLGWTLLGFYGGRYSRRLDE